MKTGQKVKIFTTIPDGQGDVIDAWVDGVMSGVVDTNGAFKAHGQESGITVHVPQSTGRNKHVFVPQSLISTVIKAA